KFVTGESYGGIRGPKIVRNLQTQQGVGVRGVIMVSPLFDYRDFSGSSLLQYMYTLPSMAAVAREAKGAVTRADLADVERYTQGEYLTDLIKGQADKEATTRLADKVAALTGIDQAVSRRLAGRFEVGEFRRDFGRGPAESVSQLRQILALDPKMKLLVGHGLFDLATPYFGSKVILDQLPAYARSDRVKLVVYPGGHMFYSRDGARQAFRAEVEALMK